MIDLRLRLPEEVKQWIEAEATRHQRSQNGQIIWILRQQMAATTADTSEETGASVSQTSAPASRAKSGAPK